MKTSLSLPLFAVICSGLDLDQRDSSLVEFNVYEGSYVQADAECPDHDSCGCHNHCSCYQSCSSDCDSNSESESDSDGVPDQGDSDTPDADGIDGLDDLDNDDNEGDGDQPFGCDFNTEVCPEHIS